MKEAPRRAGTFTVRKNGKGKLKVLLVTASRSPAWILPMGRIEDGEEPAEAAARETAEEAGFDVDVGKRIAKIKLDRRGVPGTVEFFLAENPREREWEESHKRDRKWVHVKAAHKWLPEAFHPVAEAALSRLD